MAMAAGGGGRGRRRMGGMNEINVTPLIDVMLVLLIVFMVAAPLATVDVAVELPAAPGPRPDAPLHLTLRADLSLALGGVPVARAALGGALAVAAEGGEARVLLQADRGVDTAR